MWSWRAACRGRAGRAKPQVGQRATVTMTVTLLDLLDLRAFGDNVDEVLAAPMDAAGPVDAVREIIGAVRSRGDAALRELTAEFDGVTVDELRVPSDRLDAAWRET